MTAQTMGAPGCRSIPHSTILWHRQTRHPGRASRSAAWCSSRRTPERQSACRRVTKPAGYAICPGRTSRTVVLANFRLDALPDHRLDVDAVEAVDFLDAG